ncbi:hypothetical protein ASPWEDRAFT_175365 [Aspergillus wentii DTO 134E9]|uniref:Clr5 domain-containing protein n=1 Tax=Aspergillus wentii DTO 134E9 TaxID=1073089 RepID=A0A1L9RAY0_ASPWE|nr:uncharacterized protein ASPWEDRAFT_175365 [Aspergillus wentii DTO 134E9]KAI9934638.1 hypothetical protein MW887_000254 [Aspergillus wentii]OJJ32060.1 hypothetical protein ASPWEDRAFT_175365 [Aspergillus wentii DTO 134E9]
MDGSMPPSSSISAASSSSSSAVFRPRRSDDWHEYRSRIEQLYRNHHLKLREVKKIMEREHNFVASEKQYKDRLAAWHVRKNIKAKEVQFMIRKQQKRAAQGKQTAFRVAGQPVETKRISRFIRRYGPTLDNHPHEIASHTTPEPDTPSDMSCYTPEPEERAVALTPMPEMHSNPHDNEKLEALPDSELEDVNSLPATLSPPMPAENPKPAEEIVLSNTWDDLASYQARLNDLQQNLDASLSDYITPQDD